MSDKPKLPKSPGFRDELVASLQQPRERSATEQAILSGAMSPPPTPMTAGSLSPVEEAGAKLALAMRRRHECDRYVAQVRKLVHEAEAELHAADIALADARTYLAELVEGSP